MLQIVHAYTAEHAGTGAMGRGHADILEANSMPALERGIAAASTCTNTAGRAVPP